jgi:midasin (ATPase involved in ribosome maturation)
VRGREAVKAAVVADVTALIHALSAHLNLSSKSADAVGSASRTSPTLPVSSVDAAKEYPNVKAVHTAIAGCTDEAAAQAVNALDESMLKAALDEATEVLSRLAEQDGSASPLKRLKRDDAVSSGSELSEKLAALTAQTQRALGNWQRCKALFEWQDGPLITAMKEGDVFVIDEINLAEDAVIERLNSVLESGRSITLAEKGGLSSELITAHPNFKLLATMNPGGDFGKRELSPALRSRFTEVWIPAATNPEDIALIVKEILSLDSAAMTAAKQVQGHAPSALISADLSVRIAHYMIEFMDWMNAQCSQWMLNGIQISVREILAWAKFISQSAPESTEDVLTAYIHGAFMIMLDGLGIGMSVPREKIRQLKLDCFQHLAQQCAAASAVEGGNGQVWSTSDFFLSTAIHNGDAVDHKAASISKSATEFSVGKFSIPLGPLLADADAAKDGQGQLLDPAAPQKEYVMHARITSLNLGRILRAMQLRRAILLEGAFRYICAIP